MKQLIRLTLPACLALVCTTALGAGAADPEFRQFWPQWRGPLATGEAPLAQPPTSWSETNHLKWKTEVPGSGTSTPIIWGNRVFLLTAIGAGSDGSKAGTGPAGPGGERYRFDVLCYDRRSGKLLWQKTAREEVPHEGHHPDHGFASASPVTDGLRLIAYFGSRGLHCYDFEGNLSWSKDLGHMQTRNSFGEGASPALYGNTVVVNWDDETDYDFILALDKHTGEQLWRTPRNENTGWSTPLVVEVGGKPQVIVNATGKVRSYDLATGKELWSCAGQTANAIPTPVASADTVFVTSGFRSNALFALALDRTGDLAGTDAVRWTYSKNTPYVPSPLLVDNLLYVMTLNHGMISCFNAKTGSPYFVGEKLEGLTGVYASPVAAGDRVYVLGRDGTCLVLKQGPKLEVIARNKLDDKTDASLALVGHDLFVRGHRYLYCLAED